MDAEEEDWSRAPGRAIPARELKLQFFYKGWVSNEQNRIHCPYRFPFHNRKEMAKCLGLTDAKLAGSVKYPQNLSRATENILATALGFKVYWEEWYLGTERDFAERYKLQNCIDSETAARLQFRLPDGERDGLPVVGHTGRKEGSPQQSQSEIQPASDQTVRHVNALLTKGTSIAPESSKIPGFLSIQAMPTQFGPGRLALGFEMSCGMLKAKVADIAITIRSGILILKCFPAEIDKETRKGFGKAWTFEGSAGEVTFNWDAGTTYVPRWRLTATGDSIGSLDVPPDFVTIYDLAPNDEIEISFRFNIKDTGLSDDEDILDFWSDLTIAPSSEQIETIDAASLSEVKKKLISRIATEALVDEGNGFMVHARHKFQVAAHPSEQD